ncbi:hypothetical protein Kpol_2002p105 [Vanderwaltozyma polyspora DSM 70294]|uniref:Maintenance of mitochondrial morphology protein 1 n=1 Tax=Vanderwaltozyma polyspora (strain ATCC 22028 / DSM 70294 / BCRC 21397 / CBS 2163 / NBRC 10782 / NRRL Y-8283 / UCD 57-17) TaxID=436907 RepID=MMM1_VANPO|nr:uncharacterized protein Kpol_2002p105 [Vanderwaltozyma polyspora DSM 70294]A7TFL9.1 RecName: Full=Maintenance of mitochondrial morphology protein 1 [Vanderwaltozyma polyspora DSM 70294]EDO19033.1 hypothetical protein Kpol_2002p105 [Vanderwaltozyma polyspora DSM 70294]
MNNLDNLAGNMSNLTIQGKGNETLISLDEYVNNILPSHLKKIFSDNLRENYQIPREFFESAELSGINNKIDQEIQKYSHLLKGLSNNGQTSFGSYLSNSNSFSGWSFIEGFIIGQFSVIIVLIFFIKFFVFSDGSSSNSSNPKPSLNSRSDRTSFSYKSNSMLSSNFFSSIMKRGGKTHYETDIDSGNTNRLNTILEKVYYDVDTHPSESLDWFNVLIAQTIQQFREEAWQRDNIVHSLNDFLHSKSSEMPSYLDDIKITELDIGDDFPIFSNCKIQYSPNSNKKKLEAKIYIDLNDRLAFGIETKLLVNYPKPRTAVLPVNLTVAIVRFQACLTVSLTNAEDFVPTTKETASSQDDDGYFLMFSFGPEYKMDFDIESLIGARSKLQNIPKISSVIEYHIKKWFVERCVEPRFQCIRLPSMWPRSKNTREEKVDTDDVPLSKAE